MRQNMADAFSDVFVVAGIPGRLLPAACCLVPAFFLPRKKADKPIDQSVLIGH